MLVKLFFNKKFVLIFFAVNFVDGIVFLDLTKNEYE